MSVEAICAAYERVQKKHQLPALERVALRVETERDLTPVAAWERLKALHPLEGWLQFQSRTESFMRGDLPVTEETWGLLLDAEIIDGEKRAIHLRTISPGRLQLTIATPLDPGEGDMDLLADDVRQQATGKTGHEYLCYRRYWRLDDALGAVPVFAAFQGYSHPHPTKEAQ